MEIRNHHGNVMITAHKLQNDAIRAILGIRRSESISHELEKMNVLGITELHRVALALTAFRKSKTDGSRELFPLLVARSTRPIRRRTVFQRPLTPLSQYLRQALLSKIPGVWGSIPRSIRSIPSRNRFGDEFIKQKNVCKRKS